MCDATTTRFFRPWGAVDDADGVVATDARSNAVVDQLTGSPDHEKVRHGVSSAVTGDAVSSDSDDVSSASTKLARRRSRHRSESSTETSNGSVSAVSDDGSRLDSLQMLHNLVLNSSHPGCPAPSSYGQPSAATSNETTCYATTNNYLTRSDAYLQRISMQPVSIHGLAPMTSSVPLSLSVDGSLHQAKSLSAAGQTFRYDLPGMHQLQLGMYASTMGQAMERIHLQEAAAKQMKKLRPKKFRCELCDVAFSNNGQLKGHIRIHTGERPFKCDAEGCGKSFTRNEELTRHKRIHTGVRPHGCIVCGKHFGRKDHLKKHMRTHENRDPYRVSAAALGMFALGQALPPSPPFPPYLYPF